MILWWVFSGQMCWLPLMSLVRGFLTGIVVFATHYGEDILDGDHGMTLVEQTALTSRNITGGYVMNVLTGYISLQTEHHLFPMMPTSKLDKVGPTHSPNPSPYPNPNPNPDPNLLTLSLAPALASTRRSRSCVPSSRSTGCSTASPTWSSASSTTSRRSSSRTCSSTRSRPLCRRGVRDSRRGGCGPRP